MSSIDERAPLPPTLDRRQLRALLAEAELVQGRLMETLAEAVALLEPIVVPLGLAEPGIDHQQALPPAGVDLRTECVTADQLVCGDRAVPVEHMVVGPAKDAFRHFHLIDSTGGLGSEQVVLGWGGEDHVVACDWPFTRIVSGRLVGEDSDGSEVACYEWEAGR